MSNRKVREQLERKEQKNVLYEEYKKKADLMLDYQTCRGFLKESGVGITDVVFLILKKKYDYHWQTKFIRQATNAARGVRDAEIEIPQFNYKEKVSDILSRFVKDHFNEIMRTWRNGEYPLVVRGLGEKYERMFGK